MVRIMVFALAEELCVCGLDHTVGKNKTVHDKLVGYNRCILEQTLEFFASLLSVANGTATEPSLTLL